MLHITGAGAIRGAVNIRIQSVEDEIVPLITVPVWVVITTGVKEILGALRAGPLWEAGWSPEGHPTLDWLTLRVRFPVVNCTVTLCSPKGGTTPVQLKQVTLVRPVVKLLRGRNLDMQAKLELSGSSATAARILDLALCPELRFDIRQVQDSGLLAVA